MTRGTISRLLISASWVANVTFKLPQTPRSHHCYIHSLCISALFIAFKPFPCNSCSFLRALLPPLLRQQRYDFCTSRLFSFVALHSLLNCLGLFTFMHYCVLPLLFSSLFPSPSFWVFSRGWYFLGFYPLFCLGITLLKPFSFLLSPAIYSHHDAPERKVRFSPQDPQVQL